MSEHLDTLADEALARLAKAGKRAAFEQLYERHLSPTYNRLRALLPPEAVEDVKKHFRTCHILGARVMRVVGSSLDHRNEPHGPQIERLTGIFRENQILALMDESLLNPARRGSSPAASPP